MVISIVAVIFSVLAFALSVVNFINLEAMKRSTHRVTFYDPSTQEFTSLSDEQKNKIIKEPFDNI